MRRLAFVLLFVPITLWGQNESGSPAIAIRRLTLDGADQISPAEQQRIVTEVSGQEIKIHSIDAVLERTRYALQERGFFKAEVASRQVTVIANNAGEETVDLVLQVNEGEPYRLGGISFSKNDGTNSYAFQGTQLRLAFPIRDGEVFDTDKIRRGMEALRRLYTSRGYINCTPVPETKADDGTGTIFLEVNLDEGLPFHVGTLTIDGIESWPGATMKLMQGWKQYQGELYNQEIVENFMRANAAYLPSHATEWQLFEMSQDPKNQVLNFRLHLGDISR